MNFGINTNYFFNTLPIVGKGMLAIFIVTGIIIASVMLLNRLTSKKDK